MEKDKFTELLQSEDDRINLLHQIVLDSVREEELIADKIYGVEEKLSLGEKLADKVAAFGGSWQFIIFFFIAMLLWIAVNVIFLKSASFDPYPFILLNLVLSCIAAVQAPVIMMSQNRKEARDRKRSENNYVVNMKAEIEIRNLHRKIDLLMVEQMKNLFEVQKVQMELMEEIKIQLNRG